MFLGQTPRPTFLYFPEPFPEIEDPTPRRHPAKPTQGRAGTRNLYTVIWDHGWSEMTLYRNEGRAGTTRTPLFQRRLPRDIPGAAKADSWRETWGKLAKAGECSGGERLGKHAKAGEGSSRRTSGEAREGWQRLLRENVWGSTRRAAKASPGECRAARNCGKFVRKFGKVIDTLYYEYLSAEVIDTFYNEYL